MAEPVIVTLSGELDVYRCEELERALEPTRDAPYVILDFSAVRYLDSSCLAALVRLRKARTAKGFEPSVMVKGPPQVQRVFAVTRLDEFWEQCDSLEEAHAAIAKMTARHR